MTTGEKVFIFCFRLGVLVWTLSAVLPCLLRASSGTTPTSPGESVAGPDFANSIAGGANEPPTSTETLALAVCAGVFQVTTPVLSIVVPSGKPGSIVARKRSTADAPAGSGP